MGKYVLYYSHPNKLFIVFFRLATLWHESSAPLFQDLKLLIVFNINKLQTCPFIYKMLFQQSPVPKTFITFFKLFIHILLDSLNVFMFLYVPVMLQNLIHCKSCFLEFIITIS